MRRVNVALAVPRQERDRAPGDLADRERVARRPERRLDRYLLRTIQELVEPRTPDDSDARLSCLTGHGDQATFDPALDDPDPVLAFSDFEPLLPPEPAPPESDEPDEPPASPDFDEPDAPSPPDLPASALAPASALSPEPP